MFLFLAQLSFKISFFFNSNWDVYIWLVFTNQPVDEALISIKPIKMFFRPGLWSRSLFLIRAENTTIYQKQLHSRASASWVAARYSSVLKASHCLMRSWTRRDLQKRMQNIMEQKICSRPVWFAGFVCCLNYAGRTFVTFQQWKSYK